VLGGLGFVGKHFVKYLVQNNLASKIRVVDKTLVQMARLGKEFTPIFEKVECIQTNLANAGNASKAFTDPEGDYNIVVNLAGETKLAQSDQVYAEHITQLSTNMAQEAVKHKVDKYIEVSSADVYEPRDKPNTEKDKLKPWTKIGIAKLAAENNIQQVKGLPLIIVRPAVVYGPSDIRGLAPRLCIAAVYKKTGEKMEFPQWFEEQKISTVHVQDVAAALAFIINRGEVGKIYNLVDQFQTDQKKLNASLERLFGISIGHLSLLKSEATKLLSEETLLEEVNGEHAPIWSQMIREAKLEYSPLTPWLDQETLTNKSLSVDGSAITQIGFKYEHPEVTDQLLREQIEYAVSEGWFPASMITEK